MKFIRSREGFPFSSAVVHGGSVLETVLTGADDDGTPVVGGPAAEIREIFRQLDEILEGEGLTKKNLCSARLYLQHVNRDIAEVNAVWAEYLGDHPVNRRAYGVDLQNGLLVEAGFVAEVPSYQHNGGQPYGPHRHHRVARVRTGVASALPFTIDSQA